MSHDPNAHTNNHQGSIKSIKPWLSSNKISTPPLGQLHHSINRSQDDGEIRDDDGRDEEFEFARFGEGSGETLAAGVGAGAVPQEEGDEGEDYVAGALDYDTGFLG